MYNTGTATEGDLVLGELVSQSLVLLLQRVHDRPRLSRHTTAYIAVKCIVGKLPHQKATHTNTKECVVCVCVCAYIHVLPMSPHACTHMHHVLLHN